MNKEINKEKCWLFEFALESVDGKPLSIIHGNNLMETIILWSEQNNCKIGGGYRAPKEDEFDGDLFSVI